jgi:cysteine synthase A
LLEYPNGSKSETQVYLNIITTDIKIVLADPPGSSLRNKVKYDVCFSPVEAEGHRLKHPFDTVVEGVGLNRMTDNFENAIIDDAFTISDEGIIW